MNRISEISAVVIVLAALPAAVCQAAETAWYRDAVTLLHCDNHSTPLGHGHSVDEISRWLEEIPVSAVQVSAYGAVGDRVTYNSERLPHMNYPGSAKQDTLALWREAALKAGKHFSVYINTRGFKLHLDHSDWMQCDSQGRGHGRSSELLDACARPAANNDGYLECVLLPMLNEISKRYQPAAFWVDGDHARTQTCYCRNCTAAWQKLTGQSEAPVSANNPEWPRWLELQQERYDSYRVRMAAAVHNVNSNIMYASNHSWHKTMGDGWSAHDPRTAPEGIDYYTADLSHDRSLKQSRIYAMSLSAEEHLPYEIMHSVYSPKASLTRIMQLGGVTLSSGAIWNLWISGTTITDKQARARARFCAGFADNRAEALGRTESLNQTAVLVSETSWLQQRVGGVTDAYRPNAVKNVALALQDAGYGVDIINEKMLRANPNRYRTIVVPEQHHLLPASLESIAEFMRTDGRLLFSGCPQLRNLKSAQLHECDISAITYPDFEGKMAGLMRTLGIEPEVRVLSSTPDRAHLIYAFRKKESKTILHITDITSYLNDKRILPDTSEKIDPFFKKRTLELEIACSRRPRKVTAACRQHLDYRWSSQVRDIRMNHPGILSVAMPETDLSWKWQKGILTFKLIDFVTHSAVIIENSGSAPESLPGNTAPHQYLSYAHYKIRNTIKSDFESDINGHRCDPLLQFTISKPSIGQIVLSPVNPASGRECLLFHNESARSPYTYLYTQPHGFVRGIGVLRLDIRVTDNAVARIELREQENRKLYPVGPSISIAKRKLRVEGLQTQYTFEADQWYNLKIRFPLDGQGTYALSLRAPSGDTQHFENLPCLSGSQFKSCGWIGIINSSKQGGVFAIDNFMLELQTD